jgi:hypothetical protein
MPNGAAMSLTRALARVRRRHGRVWTVGLVLVVVCLVPLADATPPDPLWIAGIYDGADFDDVVVAVISASGLVGTTILPARPAARPAELARPHDTVLAATPLCCTFTIRAPPSVRATMAVAADNPAL